MTINIGMGQVKRLFKEHHKSNNPLQLSESYLIGRGGHKKVYLYPGQPSLCVKILRAANDFDWQREMRYRRIRRWRQQQSLLLTKFYGGIATNLGEGYVFERVRDYNNVSSHTAKEFFDRAALKPWENARYQGRIHVGLSRLQAALLHDKVIVSDMELENILVQKTAADRYVLRIVDNIGTPSCLPLSCYFECFALSHVTRYWNRFITTLGKSYPQVVSLTMRQKLFLATDFPLVMRI